MKQIYEQAESVDIWLGPGDEQIDITLYSVNEFVAVSYSWQQHSDIFDDIFRPFLRSLPLISWTTIWRVLINPWWKRVWGLHRRLEMMSHWYPVISAFPWTSSTASAYFSFPRIPSTVLALVLVTASWMARQQWWMDLRKAWGFLKFADKLTDSEANNRKT